MRNYLLLLAFVFVLLFGGCGKMIDSYTRFSIKEFDAFFDITDDIGKESYIREGNLKFAELNDLIICPFIKETSHEECSLFVYVYSLGDDSKQVVVTQAALSTQSGIVLWDEDSIRQSIKLTSLSDTMLSGVAVISTFDKTEEWFYSGNEFQLSLEITVDDGTNRIQKDLTYEVKMIGHKSHLMPT